MMRFLVPCLVAALSLPLSAVAKPVLYDCDVTKKSQNINWLADKMMFVVDGPTVRVIDQHLLHFMKGPVVAKSSQRGDKLTVRWLLTEITSKNGRYMPPANYRAILDTKNRTFIAYVASSAFSSARIRGSGACKVRTDGRLPKVFR